MSRSLGNKRNEISVEQIAEITRLYGDFRETPYCKIFDNADFGYHRVTVERPERDKKGDVKADKNGAPKADTSLRDYELSYPKIQTN